MMVSLRHIPSLVLTDLNPGFLSQICSLLQIVKEGTMQNTGRLVAKSKSNRLILSQNDISVFKGLNTLSKNGQSMILWLPLWCKNIDIAMCRKDFPLVIIMLFRMARVHVFSTYVGQE